MNWKNELPNIKIETTRKYEKGTKRKPVTEFGIAVAYSGFSAVCPRCGMKWSEKKKWFSDTVSVGKQKTITGVHINARQHSCGGQNFVPTSSTPGEIDE
jgi:hypothetical protein